MKYLASLILVAVVLVGGYVWLNKSDVQVQPQGSPQYGALAGPDIPYNYLRVGGVLHTYARMALNTATTTPCTIQAPAATSTLLWTQLIITTSTSTATTWTVAKATVPNATTTLLQSPGTFSLGSATQGSMVFTASSTAMIIDPANVFAGNSYLNWGVSGTAISDATKLNGFCSAEFISLGA